MANKNWFAKIFDRIGAPAGASIAVDVAAVKTDTAAIKVVTDAVYFDSVTGGAGTDWPVGTAQSPSNVIASVITMCTARNIKKIRVSGALTLGATMQGYIFVGVNQAATITLNSKDVDNSWFYNCTVTGTQGGAGSMYTKGCILKDITNMQVMSQDDILWPGVTGLLLKDAANSYFTGSTGLLGVGPVAIDFVNCTTGASVSGIHLYNCKGSIGLHNMTHANCSAWIQGSDGCLVGVAASNVAGYVFLYGDCTVVNNTGGTAVTDLTLHTDIVSSADAIYFDSATGVGGTNPNIGTAQNPSNVIADVITMCTARKIKKIYVSGALNLEATMEGYTFVGVNKSATIALGSQDVDNSHFYNCTINGAQGGAGLMYLHNCIIVAVTNYAAFSWDCTYMASLATITPRSNSTSIMMNSSTLATLSTGATIDFTGVVHALVYITTVSGIWVANNSTDADNGVTMFTSAGGILSTVASDTAGTFNIFGTGWGLFNGVGTTEMNYTDLAQIGTYTGDGGILVDSNVKAQLDLQDLALTALAVKTTAGKPQVKITTVDLHNGAGALDVATCATQAVIIDSIVFSPRVNISDDAGAFTGISIQDNDTTVHQFISTSSGLKANLTQYAQLSWTGAIKIRVGNKIQCTIIGGSAEADPTTCDVEITYHAAVDGGTL